MVSHQVRSSFGAATGHGKQRQQTETTTITCIVGMDGCKGMLCLHAAWLFGSRWQSGLNHPTRLFIPIAPCADPHAAALVIRKVPKACRTAAMCAFIDDCCPWQAYLFDVPAADFATLAPAHIVHALLLVMQCCMAC